MCYINVRSTGIKNIEAYYSTGTWATYDVIKKPSTMTNIRCSWIGTNVSPQTTPANLTSSYERQMVRLA